MKQILQHLRSGQIEVADVPCPIVRPRHVLVQTTRTLISAGTERMLVEFSKGSLLAKARAQPDKVKQVLQKIRTDGLLPTLETVFSRLDEPLPLGYCNVGRVVEVGRDVTEFSVGDRVISNGPHAEMVCVPATLCAKVPDDVADDAASFTVLGSIALHGIRLLEPTFGERFVVVGLGLLGQIAVQILRAHGCPVLGVDVNPQRCELARSFGAETVALADGGDPVKAAEAFTQGRGADGVLITASAKSDEIMQQAAAMSRKRGRIILVGVVGLNLRRSDFYEKELHFQVSCSYGPGRYDTTYEDQGRDYPLPYVRWTEGRNFEALLDAMREGWLKIDPLITRRIAQADAPDAYDAILNDAGVLGVVLTYPEQSPPTQRTIRLNGNVRPTQPLPTRPRVAVVGAGNFTKLVLLPAIKAAGAPIHSVISAGGVTGLHASRKFDAEEAGSDYRAVLDRDDVDAIFVTTRHASHARMVSEAIAAGKHVFVEKPLAIDEEGLEAVQAAHRDHSDRQIMVGFNRRFAPHTQTALTMLKGRSQPLAINCLVNAGHIPANHWTQDPLVGGGRIVGEGCHFIDLLRALVGHPITTVYATMFGEQAGPLAEDKMSISLRFADGSLGTIHYWANGGKSFPKERIEIFSEGRVLEIDNWRTLRPYDWPGARKRTARQDKGHKAEVRAFLDAIQAGSEPLIPFAELDEVTRASFAAVRAARSGLPIELT